MTWWIAFIIAVLGWFFTAKQNAKSNARTLLNQEIKDAREKLHGIMVSCSASDKNFPFLAKDEINIKMQNYIVAIQEVDRLYNSYHFPFFKRIKILNWLFSQWSFFPIMLFW
ncbi:hypothetical protein BZG22_12900 [Salinivibrio sp. IB870]|uniref:hypothetical protein n=1 Tax=unclassified Salinivibrio TaxID=2636825 RepID=UPI0009867D12|nr:MULTISPECIES: hypothetical protein [unclassified Salinivibrio]OOE72584.1 hypothetical protein BZG22_12900 [Salinivibrio sp. IB870]